MGMMRKLSIQQVAPERRSSKDLFYVVVRNGEVVTEKSLSWLASYGKTTREDALLTLLNSLEVGESVVFYRKE